MADLINSITCANANGAGTNDVIDLTDDGTYTLTAPDNIDFTNGSNGLPVIADAGIAGTLTIHGHNATITRSSAGGTDSFRILAVAANGDLSIDNLTLTNGNSTHYGGAISNRGNLTITQATFSANTASQGGALLNYNGTLDISASTVTANTRQQRGWYLHLQWNHYAEQFINLWQFRELWRRRYPEHCQLK